MSFYHDYDDYEATTAELEADYNRVWPLGDTPEQLAAEFADIAAEEAIAKQDELEARGPVFHVTPKFDEIPF